MPKAYMFISLLFQFFILAVTSISVAQETQAQLPGVASPQENRYSNFGVEQDFLVHDEDVQRIYKTYEDSHAYTMIVLTDVSLDLPALLQQQQEVSLSPRIAQRPAMVAGEGDDLQNHTLIKVLNRNGICTLQFLAYPVDVRGGVNVNVARLGPQKMIVANPISDANVRQLRLFNKWGGNNGTIKIDSKISAPFSVVCGNFLPSNEGDEIAVTNRFGKANKTTLQFISAAGKVLEEKYLPIQVDDEIFLSVKHISQCDELIIKYSSNQNFLQYNAKSDKIHVYNNEHLPKGTGVFPSAFGEDEFLAPVVDDAVSEILKFNHSKSTQTIDAGRYENMFWYQWHSEGVEKLSDDRFFSTGQWIKPSTYRHYRTDCGWLEQLKKVPDNDKKSVRSAYTEKVTRDIERLSRLSTPQWEPCFTHRQPTKLFEEFADIKCDVTGLPKYSALSRLNNIATYCEFEAVGFTVSTYAPNLPMLEELYTWPLGEFLRQLASKYYENPEAIAGLEPNHEHEIAVEQDETIGDYNPYMIRGFYHYLEKMYGVRWPEIQKKYDLAGLEKFDAPRNLNRGLWDQYNNENPYFKDWVNYSRYVVMRRIAQTYACALMAGFPPEYIKSHQIPDTYALESLANFSKVIRRITPIDWILNSGCGFGFTRYSVWYQNQHNVLIDAKNCGFDGITVGEYQALTPDNESAYQQLKFVFNNGGQSVHCMQWPMGFDKGYNDSMDFAIKRLVQENDTRRPGYTGGVGIIRAYRHGDMRINIASIGTGEKHTGLLKSLNQDGSFEGSVYVVPFHSRVNVNVIECKEFISLREGQPIRIGPVPAFDSGEQIEVIFDASSEKEKASMVFYLSSENRKLPGTQGIIKITPQLRQYRIVLRNQMPIEGLMMNFETYDFTDEIEINNYKVLRESENTVKTQKGIFDGIRHQGGVMFDILE